MLSRVRVANICRQYHVIARTLSEKVGEPLAFVKVNDASSSESNSLAKISEALSAIKAAKLEIVEALNLIENETAVLEERLATLGTSADPVPLEDTTISSTTGQLLSNEVVDGAPVGRVDELVSSTDVIPVAATEEISAAATEEISAAAETEEIPAAATEEISAAATEEISAAATEEISVAATEEISAASSEEISVAATEETYTAVTEEISVAATEEISAAATEEISVAATEEISVAATEEISAAASEEISVAETEEIAAAKTEEISVAATEEISAAATEEISAAATEEISAASSEEISVAATEETSTAVTEEIAAAETEEISVAATEEISAAATEEISVALTEEISAAAIEEISAADTEEISAATAEENSAASTEEISAATTEEISAAVQPETADKVADFSKKVGEKVVEKLVSEAVVDAVKESLPTESIETPLVEEVAQVSSDSTSAPETLFVETPEDTVEAKTTDAVFKDLDTDSKPSTDEHVVLEPLSSLPVVDEETLGRIAGISDRYCTPVGYHLAMPFIDFVSIKKHQKIKQQVLGLSGFVGGILGYGYASYHQFPQYFGPEPTMIMGFDSLVIVGSGILGLSIITSGGMSYFNSKMLLAFSSKKKPYNERLLDFNRRMNFHRCSGSTSQSDDYYGEKIMDLSDYRFWVRKQQEKKAELAKPKKSFFKKRRE